MTAIAEAGSDVRERTTPHNIEAEKCVLGAILIDNQQFNAAAEFIDDRDFFRDAHRRIWNKMVVLSERGDAIDLVTLKDELARSAELEEVGGPAYIVGLTDGVPRAANVPYYAGIVKKEAAARAALQLLRSTTTSILADPSAITNGLAKRHREAWDEITRAFVDDAIEGACRSLPDLISQIESAPARPMVFEQLLAGGEIALLHGQPRDGKTWCGCELAVAKALGRAPFGLTRLQAPSIGRTLIVSNEDSPALYAHRLRLISAAHGSHPPAEVFLLVGAGLSLDTATGRDQVAGMVRHHAIDLVILDPARSLTACVDKGPSELQPFARFLRHLTSSTGAAVLVVHHDTKPQAGIPDHRRRAQRSSGGGLFSVVDAPMHIERLDEVRSLLTPDGFKHRPDPEPIIIRREVSSDYARLTGESTTGIAAADVALHAAIVEYLRTSGGGSGRAIATAIRRRRDDVNRALEQLLEAGTVDQAEGARRAKLWCLR